MIITLGRARIRITDVVAFWREMRSIERASKLPEIGGRIQPTEQMLRRLAEWLASRGLRGCTVTAAWQVWRIVSDHLIQVQRDARGMADLAFWYGIDPHRLTQRQRDGLTLNLDRVKAQRQIESGKFDPLDYEGIYHLVMLAYDDEDLAQSHKTAALERYVDHKVRTGGGEKR